MKLVAVEFAYALVRKVSSAYMNILTEIDKKKNKLKDNTI